MLEAVVVVAVVSAYLGKTTADYMKDMYNNGKQLADGTPEEATEVVERAYAIADLMLLAVAADGEFTEGELAYLREHIDLEAIGMTFEQLVERLHWKEQQVLNNDRLRISMRAQVDKLNEHDREIAYCMLLELHRAGARLDRLGGYRESHAQGRSDNLLALFGGELGLSDERREQLEQEQLALN